MANFYDALKANIKDSVCSFLNDAAAYKRTFDKIGPFDTPVSFLPNAPALAAGLFCNRAPSIPSLPPQLTGGQCPTGYRVRASGSYISKNPNDGSETTTTINPFPNALRTGTGPVTIVFNGLVPHGNNAGGVWDVNPYNVRLSIQFAGEPVYDFYWGPCVSGSVTPIAERTDGQPDNCGDAPPFIPPFSPGSNVINNNTTFVNNNNITVTIPTTLEIGIGDINVNGELNIPVTVKIGTINLEASVNFNTGNIDFGISFDNSQDTYIPTTGSDCLPSGRPTSPLPTRPPTSPDPGDNPTDKQERAVLVGVICKLSNLPGSASVILTPNSATPDVIVPYGALLFFSYRVGNSSVFGEDIKIKHSYQYVPCPFPGQAIGYKIAPREPGIQIESTPVYGRPNLFKSS